MDWPVVEEENTYERLEIVHAPDVLCVEADDDFEILVAPLAGHVGAGYRVEAVDETRIVEGDGDGGAPLYGWKAPPWSFVE
jgi:hypothetical protein